MSNPFNNTIYNSNSYNNYNNNSVIQSKHAPPNAHSPYLSDTARNSLFEGATNNGGRRFGGGETDYTQGLSNQQILEINDAKFKEQDKVFEALSYSLSNQKEIAIRIGDEAQSQSKLLDDLGVHVDHTHNRLKNATKSIVRLGQEARTTKYWIIICILFLVLIVVSAFAMST